jgi:hypothetical protein
LETQVMLCAGRRSYYVVVMGGYAKADARRLKDAMADWLQTHLGLRQHPAKTRITHWS